MTRLSKKGREADTLGGRLTRSRLSKGWTQHQLASAAGTSQAVVQRIETGKCRHPRIVRSLASVLSVSPAWLMFGAEVVDDVEQEAIETARAWSLLPEPHRSALKRMILQMAAAVERMQAQDAQAPSSPTCPPDGDGAADDSSS